MSGTEGFVADIQYLTYEYDKVGNLAYRSDQRNVNDHLEEWFTYDGVNRLTVTERKDENENREEVEENFYDLGGRLDRRERKLDNGQYGVYQDFSYESNSYPCSHQ